MRIVKLLFIIFFGLFQSCSTEYDSNCSTETGLYELTNDFNIGVASTGFNYYTPEYGDIVKTQFNQLTTENTFKAEYIQPFEGDFFFDGAYQFIQFAQEFNKKVHGHCLIWHNQLPIWMQEFDGSRNEWIVLMKEHIQTIVGTIGNDVSAWDVVNEAFNDDGSFRETIWYNNIGPEYIQLAFEFAHEANPNALLFYNDYNIAAKPKKLEAIIEHLNRLKECGIAIHGIGMQLHISYNYPSQNKIESAAYTIAKNGYLVHFSEIDISVNPNGGDVRFKEQKFQKQADKIVELLEIYNNLPASSQYAFTLWGVYDAGSWIPNYWGKEDYPLLFDINLEAKPAYCALKNALLLQ